jgi:hypothetical protein
MRMIGAHMALLRAELQITGKELGIIVALAGGAFAIAVLVAILLYVGTFLFLGDWLFGSMGWGIIHGTLIGAVFLAYVGINLAGGHLSRYGWGGVIGVIVGVVLAVLLLSNVGNESGEWLRRFLEGEFVTEDLPFGAEWLVTLGGAAVVGIIALVVGLIIGWRVDQRGRALVGVGIVSFVLGAFVGAIYASTRYDAPDGVFGLALMVGLLTWIIAGIILAVRAGFDPEARYADLVPRESFEAFNKTKEFLLEQWERQKGKVLGR